MNRLLSWNQQQYHTDQKVFILMSKLIDDDFAGQKHQYSSKKIVRVNKQMSNKWGLDHFSRKKSVPYCKY